MKRLTKLVALCFVFALAATPVITHAQDKTPAKAEKSKEKSKDAPKPKQVDINTASAADLQKLPGIDAATADKIIAGRPYANKAQLTSKKIVTDAVYTGIQEKIVAKQPKKEGDAKKEPSGKAKGQDKGKGKEKKAAE